MTKMKNHKRALVIGVIALLMCVAMFISSSLAWFSADISSGSNKIKTGTLSLQLQMHDGTKYVDISKDSSPIFGEDTLWEPNTTQVAYLAIENTGTLAVDYTVVLDVKDGQDEKNLYEVLEYAITPVSVNNVNEDTFKSIDWQGVTPGRHVISADVLHGVDESRGAVLSDDVDVTLNVKETHYYALSIHMDKDADPEYQGAEITFDLNIYAKQATVELDSVGNSYDADATYPENASIPEPTTTPKKQITLPE